MKKIKIAFLLVALGFAGLIIYQNMDYLSMPVKLEMHLWIAGSYDYGIRNGQLILSSFLAGLLISYFFGLSFRFKTKKNVKNLNATINSHVETITSLKSEISKSQGITPQQAPPQPEVPVDNT
jgi:hypothetical protein